MKRSSLLSNLAVIILAVLPLIFLAVIWNNLPETVPMHYDAHFNPDKMGAKRNLWALNGFLSLVSIGIYLLLTNLYRFDPKRKNQPPSLTFNRIAFAVVLFIMVLNFIILMSVANYIKLSPKLLFVLFGLLITILGNYMNTIKPNYFAGLRLPWTLSSDYNWKKTHQLAGKIWFWSGLVMAAIGLLVPPAYSLEVFFMLLGIIIIIPIIYSYRLFKHEKINAGN